MEEASDKSRRLWLVRHGLTSWNRRQRFCGHNDISLAPEGYSQARWLAQQLRTERVGAIYASDLRRARETAEVIADARDQPLPIKAVTAWRELDFGEWDGLTYEAIAARFPEQLGFFTNPEQFSPPGGETLAQLKQRVLAGLAQLMTEQSKGDLVLVSHGGPLRMLLCCVLSMPLARQWQLVLEPGSLSTLDLLPVGDTSIPLGTLTLLNFCDIAHSRITRKHIHA